MCQAHHKSATPPEMTLSSQSCSTYCLCLSSTVCPGFSNHLPETFVGSVSNTAAERAGLRKKEKKGGDSERVTGVRERGPEFKSPAPA